MYCKEERGMVERIKDVLRSSSSEVVAMTIDDIYLELNSDFKRYQSIMYDVAQELYFECIDDDRMGDMIDVKIEASYQFNKTGRPKTSFEISDKEYFVKR